MGRIVDPMDALPSFEPALKRGELDISWGTVHPEVLVHLDKPDGKMRATYAKMRGSSVEALAMIAPAGFEDRTPVFQIAYAVPQHLRNRGFAKQIATKAIDEFAEGVLVVPIKRFYIEAMVSRKNIASQKVAEAIIGGERRETACELSGEPTYAYIKLVQTG